MPSSYTAAKNYQFPGFNPANSTISLEEENTLFLGLLCEDLAILGDFMVLA